MEQHLDYQLLAESIPHLAWIAQPDGTIYWFNRRWYEYTGAAWEQMGGWGWTAALHPTRLDEVLLRWRQAIAAGRPFEMTFPLRRADGVFRPFLTRVIPYKDAHGTVLRWFGTHTDVALEQEAVLALKESEQRFRTATEAVSGILWTNDPEGRMQGEQPGWSSYTGQTQAEYSGYGWSAVVHPDDRQPTIDAWESAVAEQRLFCFEHRVRRRDGFYRLCSIRALPVRDENGTVREWVGVHTDITEDRARQEALRETIAALRRHEELVEVAEITNNFGFWRFHPATGESFLSSGSRHLFGLPATGDLRPEDALARFHPDDAPRIAQSLEKAMVTGHYAEEFRVRVPDGATPRWIQGVARIVQPDSGPPYLVGLNMDITQQKRSAEALIRAEKLAIAGRLAASIAHEINNPLEAITNLLYLLLQGDLTEEQRGFCLTMMSELTRVTEIATHTLRFHRQSTSRGRTQSRALVESVLALFEGRMRNASVIASCRLHATQEILGFEGELRQVLANLVGNGIDAMANVPGPRTLFIRSRDGRNWAADQPGVWITVADTGTGIAPAALAHIFDPFFTTKGETGTGLGLWVSSELVGKHGGHLTVRSRVAPGRHGTVFRLFLPSDPPQPS